VQKAFDTLVFRRSQARICHGTRKGSFTSEHSGRRSEPLHRAGPGVLPPADRHVRLYAQHANSIFDSPMTRLPLTALPGRRINLVERIAFCPRPHSLLAVIGSALAD